MTAAIPPFILTRILGLNEGTKIDEHKRFISRCPALSKLIGIGIFTINIFTEIELFSYITLLYIYM